MLFNEPFSRDIAVVRKMTLTQILIVIRGRNEDGTLKVGVPPSPPAAGDNTSLYLDAIGVREPEKRAAIRAKYEPQPGGTGLGAAAAG